MAVLEQTVVSVVWVQYVNARFGSRGDTHRTVVKTENGESFVVHTTLPLVRGLPLRLNVPSGGRMGSPHLIGTLILSGCK